MALTWVRIANLRGPMGPAGDAAALMELAGIKAKLATGLYHVRALVTGEDVSEVAAPGVYSVTSTGIAVSLVNLPEPVPGSLIVAGPASGIRTQTYTPNNGGMYVRSISTSSGQFGPWQQLDARGRLIPDGTNIQTFRDLGPWRVATAASANTMTNRPPIPAAPAQVTNLSHNGSNGTLRLWYDTNGNGVWFQSLSASLAWTGWERLGGGVAHDHAAGHGINVQRERQATGGAVGTKGLGVFAIRIDHNMTGMMTKLLPMLRARSLPASMCHFVNEMNPQPGYAGDISTGYGWADVQRLTLNDGIETWSHGWSHQDASGLPALEKEILASRTELETQMPRVRVKGFMVPGTSGSNWGGFTSALADPSVWHRTEAGRLVMYGYAYANGGGGILNPLATGQTLGWQSYDISSSSGADSAIGVLKQAQDARAGAVIMIHPNMIDAANGISSAVLGEILDYIAAERDAGRAMVLTVSGMLNADPERNTRHNLVRDPEFSAAFSNWAGATGWTVSNGVASTASGGLIGQDISLAAHAYAQGSTRELYMEVRAPAGAVVRVRATDSTAPASWDASFDTALPASSNWVVVRKPVTVPATGISAAHLEFGRVSGGAIDVRNPGLLSL